MHAEGTYLRARSDEVDPCVLCNGSSCDGDSDHRVELVASVDFARVKPDDCDVALVQTDYAAEAIGGVGRVKGQRVELAQGGRAESMIAVEKRALRKVVSSAMHCSFAIGLGRLSTI